MVRTSAEGARTKEKALGIWFMQEKRLPWVLAHAVIALLAYKMVYRVVWWSQLANLFCQKVD